MARCLNVALVELGFGAEFIPIYQRHPHARCLAICQRNRERLDAVGEAFDIERRYTDFTELLPEAIRPFTTHGVYDSADKRHRSFVQGSGHGGSHPHLVHEFVSAVLDDRPTFPDVYQSTN